MQHLAEYWIDKAEGPDELLVERGGIDAFNRFAFASDPNLVDLAAYPGEMCGDEIANIIRSISKPYGKDLFYRNGGAVTQVNYDRYADAVNLDALSASVNIRFGLIVRRADMRTWPTEDIVFKSPETFELDRFQENGLFPSDVVAILHASTDGLWYFVQSYNYAAWVRKDAVAIGDRQKIMNYRDDPQFLVVTDSKVLTNASQRVPAVSEVQLDMGVRLPLSDPGLKPQDFDRQNPSACYAVKLPVRNDDGTLRLVTALVSTSQDVSHDYLPYTRRNIIQQAFKFLGEHYGWGHSCNARDCTGLVSEVYKTLGIYLPRNSEQQGSSPIGSSIRFAPDDAAGDKLAVLECADVGDLLYAPGHVMMYLGSVDGQPYVIHDLSGSGCLDEDGKRRDGLIRGVSVTPLTPVLMSQQETYFEKLYAVKRIR